MLHSALSVSLSRSFKQVVEGLCVAASVLLEKAANPYYPARNSYSLARVRLCKATLSLHTPHSSFVHSPQLPRHSFSYKYSVFSLEIMHSSSRYIILQKLYHQ